jgi:hypothetical protein
MCGNLLVNLGSDEVAEAVAVNGGRGASSAVRWHAVQASVDDRTFVLGDRVFEARTSCFQVRVGDRAIFVSGSANKPCVHAVFIIERTKKLCAVWCK